MPPVTWPVLTSAYERGVRAAGNSAMIPNFPARLRGWLLLSGSVSRDLPRGSPDLNNSTAGGKNNPAWVRHRSDAKAVLALRWRLWGDTHGCNCKNIPLLMEQRRKEGVDTDERQWWRACRSLLGFIIRGLITQRCIMPFSSLPLNGSPASFLHLLHPFMHRYSVGSPLFSLSLLSPLSPR